MDEEEEEEEHSAAEFCGARRYRKKRPSNVMGLSFSVFEVKGLAFTSPTKLCRFRVIFTLGFLNYFFIYQIC